MKNIKIKSLCWLHKSVARGGDGGGEWRGDHVTQTHLA